MKEKKNTDPWSAKTAGMCVSCKCPRTLKAARGPWSCVGWLEGPGDRHSMPRTGGKFAS